jgi:hypothetical protein
MPPRDRGSHGEHRRGVTSSREGDEARRVAKLLKRLTLKEVPRRRSVRRWRYLGIGSEHPADRKFQWRHPVEHRSPIAHLTSYALGRIV